MTAFQRWAFAPVDTAPMAALRIACGVLVLGWTVSLLPDLGTFLHDSGLTQQSVGGTRGWWTLDGVAEQPAAIVLLLIAAVALTVGWHTRLASVLVVLLLVVIQRRDVYMLNSGDLLLRHLALYLTLMPAGETWSLDARRRGTSSLRAPWGLRMLQVQVSVVYLFSVAAKLHGDNWQDGTAVGRAVQLADLQRFVIPQGIATNIGASALATYGTLLVEGALVFGLWLPRFRWWVMAAGVSIHLGIEATLLVGWFSLTIISCYLAFVPPEVLRRVVGQVLERVRPTGQHLPAEAGVPAAVPTAAWAPGSAASPYRVGAWGESGHDAAKRLTVPLTPAQVNGPDPSSRTHEAMGEVLARHSEAQHVTSEQEPPDPSPPNADAEPDRDDSEAPAEHSDGPDETHEGGESPSPPPGPAGLF